LNALWFAIFAPIHKQIVANEAAAASVGVPQWRPPFDFLDWYANDVFHPGLSHVGSWWCNLTGADHFGLDVNFNVSIPIGPLYYPAQQLLNNPYTQSQLPPGVSNILNQALQYPQYGSANFHGGFQYVYFHQTGETGTYVTGGGGPTFSPKPAVPGVSANAGVLTGSGGVKPSDWTGPFVGINGSYYGGNGIGGFGGIYHSTAPDSNGADINGGMIGIGLGTPGVQSGPDLSGAWQIDDVVNGVYEWLNR
jgi:hypothetical protein